MPKITLQKYLEEYVLKITLETLYMVGIVLSLQPSLLSFLEVFYITLEKVLIKVVKLFIKF